MAVYLNKKLLAVALATGVTVGAYNTFGNRGGEPAQPAQTTRQERGFIGRMYDRLFGEEPKVEPPARGDVRSSAHEFVVSRLQKEHSDALVQKFRSDVRNGDIFYSLPDEKGEFIYVFRPSTMLGDHMAHVKLCEGYRPCDVEFDTANFGGYRLGKWTADTTTKVRDKAQEIGKDVEERLDRSSSKGPWAGRRKK